jgi:hypothetical protein
MTDLPYTFPFSGGGLFESQLRNFINTFPDNGLSNPETRKAMDELFLSLKAMATDENYSYAGLLAIRTVADLMRYHFSTSETARFPRNLALLERYQFFDLKLLNQAKTHAKEAFSSHLKTGGTFTDWPARDKARDLFGKNKHEAPSWAESWDWNIEPVAPGYKLRQMLATYLVKPELLGVMRLSLERVLMIHHFRQSSVLKNLCKQSPALLEANQIKGHPVGDALDMISQRVDWLRHRDAHIANALYEKGRNGKVFVDSIGDKRWALHRITEKLLQYKPNPDYLVPYVSMVLDLAEHLNADECDQPIKTVMHLLTLPLMADKLNIEDIASRAHSLDLHVEARLAVDQMQRINGLRKDEKKWVHALVDAGMKKDVLAHLSSKYYDKKLRMFKLNELGLLDDRKASQTLMADVLMEDLGL